MVPGAGIEPAQPLGPRDFKSLASTNSATQAFDIIRLLGFTHAIKNYHFPRKIVLFETFYYVFFTFLTNKTSINSVKSYTT